MIIAIDFDGTCVDHRFPDIGPEVPYAIETLLKLNKQGHKLILWTMRSDEYLDEAAKWFHKNGIKLFGVQRNPEQDSWTNSPKAYAHLYIDDAAFGAPLIELAAFKRPCIDWKEVQRFFKLDGV